MSSGYMSSISYQIFGFKNFFISSSKIRSLHIYGSFLLNFNMKIPTDPLDHVPYKASLKRGNLS